MKRTLFAGALSVLLGLVYLGLQPIEAAAGLRLLAWLLVLAPAALIPRDPGNSALLLLASALLIPSWAWALSLLEGDKLGPGFQALMLGLLLLALGALAFMLRNLIEALRSSS